MAVRPLIILPDPLLKRVSLPVDAVTDDIRALMDDMLDTM
jgi:peptide deformylase